MTRLKFTPEMFHPCHGSFHVDADKMAADICNRAFDEWLLEQPILYTSNSRNRPKCLWVNEFNEIDEPIGATHRARLCAIEEINPKACVDHIPKLRSTQPVGVPVTRDYYGAALMLGCSIVCSQCGVDLKATWTPA